MNVSSAASSTDLRNNYCCADNYRSSRSKSRGTTPVHSYTDALVKASQRSREKAFSPTRSFENVDTWTPSQYSANKDYYRGYTKSIYEREPLFTDFVQNIPTAAKNVYSSSNLHKLKNQFQDMIEQKWGKKQLNDPTIDHDIAAKAMPWGNYIGKSEPASLALARKHSARASTPPTNPRIYIYHRSTQRY